MSCRVLRWAAARDQWGVGRSVWLWRRTCRPLGSSLSLVHGWFKRATAGCMCGPCRVPQVLEQLREGKQKDIDEWVEYVQTAPVQESVGAYLASLKKRKK